MQVNITFRGMESTDSLKAHTHERLEHLSKYLDRASEAHVVLSLERYLHHADVTIHAGPFLLRGRTKSEDMYKSIDEAADKIERQLKRYKDKLKTLKHKATARKPAEGAEIHARHDVFAEGGNAETEEAEHWTEGPRIIRSDEFVLKPMSVEEAVMQMDLMNNDFLVFLNEQSSEVNVVYRRKDGHFGLIEASMARSSAKSARRNGETRV